MIRSLPNSKDLASLSSVSCTACNDSIDHKKSALFLHPMLHVLMCEKCKKFYSLGNWSRDETGQDEYCRWCGEGGNLFICCDEACLRGFCKRCIKRNFGRNECKRIEDDDNWQCYNCNPDSLKEAQDWADSVVEFVEKLQKNDRRSKKFSRAIRPKEGNANYAVTSQSSLIGLCSAMYNALNDANSEKSQPEIFELLGSIKANVASLENAVERNDLEEAAKLVQPDSRSSSSVPLAILGPEYDSDAGENDTHSHSRPESMKSESSRKRRKKTDTTNCEKGFLFDSALKSIEHESTNVRESPFESSNDEDSTSSDRMAAIDTCFEDDRSSRFENTAAKHSDKDAEANIETAIKSEQGNAEGNAEGSDKGNAAGSDKGNAEGNADPSEESDACNDEDSDDREAAAAAAADRNDEDSDDREAAAAAADRNDEDSDEEEASINDRKSMNKQKQLDKGLDKGLAEKRADDEANAPQNETNSKRNHNSIDDFEEVERIFCDYKIFDDEIVEDDGSPNTSRLIKDKFGSKRVVIKLKPLETLLNQGEATGSETQSANESDEQLLEDRELFKLLKDPVRRKTLKKDIQHAITTLRKVSKKSPKPKIQNDFANLISDSDSDNNNSNSNNNNNKDYSRRDSDLSSDDRLPSPPRATSSSLFDKLVWDKLEEESEVMPVPPSSESENEIEVIAEVRSTRHRKTRQNAKTEQKRDSAESVEENDTDDENDDKEDDDDDDDSEILKKRVPASVKEGPSTSGSKRKTAPKDSDSDVSVPPPRKRSKRRKVRIIDSDEEGNADNSENQDLEELSPLVSDSGSELEEPEKPKRKRKSKKKKTTIEDSESDRENKNDGDEKKSRSIRKIITDDKVDKESRAAAKEEAERRKRVLERQKLYNEIEEAIQKERKTDKVSRCVLEYDPDTKEPVIEVDEALVKHMKPHQVEGVKFLYNTVIESVDQLSKGKPGGGAILAHCMGLGKTFQTICFIHTLLTHNSLKEHVRKIIVVCPCNVVLNWAREVELWIDENEHVKEGIPLYEFSRVKHINDRVDMLEDWNKHGGVLIIGYSMFRVMTLTKTKSRKIKDRIPKLLHDPGADVVICDEGHTLKSDKAQISKAMNLIRTKRRIILTGTPLQNNMSEYHCMVSFVKPNLLGTPKEFNNRFMNPITFGQEANASTYAVRLMKKRVHILNKLLAGCVHRCDYCHLTPYLPAKFEYIISIELSELQMKLYREYLKFIGVTDDTTKEDLKGRSLLKDYQALKMLWTHPYLLLESEDRQEDKRQKEAYKNQLDEFVVDGSDDDLELSQSGSNTSDNNDGSDVDEVVKTYKTRRSRRENPDEKSESEEETMKNKYDKTWWNCHVPQEDEEFISLQLSSKLTLAFDILRECELIGDKVILFSTSLLTLDLFEKHLQIEYDKSSRENVEGDYINSWVHGFDYFRLDGSTSVDTRKKYIDHFNDLANMRARLFLVSTKAGGIGANMVGANRIIVLDASWNPSDDTQAIFRAYRYGQTKPVYVYRLLSHATMEEKIYDRQVNKISLACRVVDEQNLERHFNESDLKALYEFKPEKDARKTPSLPKDRLLADLLIRHKLLITGYHEHDSLLQKELEDELTEEERKQAWKEYEDERDGKAPQTQYSMPGGMPGMPNMPGMPGMAGMAGMPRMPGMPGFAMPGTSGANPAQWNAQLASQFAAQFQTFARQHHEKSAPYAALYNQFMQNARMNQPQTRPRQDYRQQQMHYAHTGSSLSREEILKRPPFFNFRINHPSLDPQQILNEIKLKYPNADQLAIAVHFRNALLAKKNFYAVGFIRSQQSVEAYRKQGVAAPKVCTDMLAECDSGVKLLDQLVIKLDEAVQKARADLHSRKGAGSSRGAVPVIDLNETITEDDDVQVINPSSSKTGVKGPIIEEIE